MDGSKLYSLPKLLYDFKVLAPAITEEALTLHYTKHHQAFVTGANAVPGKSGKARKENADLDMNATFRELSFPIGGYRLHSLFWENLAPAGKGGGVPEGERAKVTDAGYGSIARFNKEFTQTASSTEGSGWSDLPDA
jgi:superoxide dismutase, Fe-Mn family